MQITATEMYWLTRLDPINATCIVAVTTSSIGLLVGLIGMCINKADDDEEYLAFKKVTQMTLPIFLLSICGAVFVPTTKEMCAIKLVPAIVNNVEVQGLSSDVIQLGREWLDELKPSPRTEAK